MEEYYNHDQSSYFPITMQIICGVICFAGLLIMFELFLVGFLMFLGGLFIILCRCGIEIDFNKNKYRDYWEPMIVKFGKWEDLPVVEYISVFKAKTSQTVFTPVSAISYDEEEIQVNLITDNKKRITVFETDEKRRAIDKAWKFAKKLNVGILDATERESEWIKE